MIKEEVDLVLPLIDGGETGKITRNAFTEWVVIFKHFSFIKFFMATIAFSLGFGFTRLQKKTLGKTNTF